MFAILVNESLFDGVCVYRQRSLGIDHVTMIIYNSMILRYNWTKKMIV